MVCQGCGMMGKQWIGFRGVTIESPANAPSTTTCLAWLIKPGMGNVGRVKSLDADRPRLRVQNARRSRLDSASCTIFRIRRGSDVG